MANTISLRPSDIGKGLVAIPTGAPDKLEQFMKRFAGLWAGDPAANGPFGQPTAPAETKPPEEKKENDQRPGITLKTTPAVSNTVPTVPNVAAPLGDASVASLGDQIV